MELLGADLRPEAQLLLHCAHTQVGAGDAAQIIALVQNGVNWRHLLQLALRHNLAPLLYRNLVAVAHTMLPETVRAELKEQVQVDIQGNLFLTQELLYLLALFNQRNLLAVPYKGPVLAASIYGDLGLRPFKDLDILVHEQDTLQALALLVSCGYEIIRPPGVAQLDKNLQPRRIAQLMEKSSWAYQLVLWRPARQTVVELHWRITPKYVFSRDTAQLWRNLKPVTVAGASFPSFAPEDLLWFLCIHGAKHQWRQLNWLGDIAELIRVYPGLDWDRIVAQATKLSTERRLYLGLLLANGLLKTPLPEAIETKIRTAPHLNDLAQQVIELVFNRAEQTFDSPTIEQLAFQLRTLDRMVDRSRYLLHFASKIVTPTGDDRASVKSPFLPALFSALLRPLRLAKTHGLHQFRRRFGAQAKSRTKPEL